MSRELRALIADLKKIPKDLGRRLRPAIRGAAEPIASDARSRASWSTRIPGATRISTSLAGKHPGVAITVSQAKAPHARAYEHQGQPGTFRHPVFGNREVWVAQAARPFLWPAAQAHADQVTDTVDQTVASVARQHGFR